MLSTNILDKERDPFEKFPPMPQIFPLALLGCKAARMFLHVCLTFPLELDLFGIHSLEPSRKVHRHDGTAYLWAVFK
jgi:hypothetical protein